MPVESPFEWRRPLPEPSVIATKCPIPGCIRLQERGNLLCLKHAVEVWGNVQLANGDPLVQDAILESVADRAQRTADEEARRAAVRKASGWIYYIRVDDKIKIGWTSNVDQRMKSYPPHTGDDHPASGHASG